MTSTQTLIAEIDAFLERTRMAESTFGMKAVRNPRLLPRLRRGDSCTLDTADKLRAFMREHLPATPSLETAP